MPIKWTPEIDQILLLKILETSQVNADVKAISAAWPDAYEKPTPRAITERLVKIRATSKSNGAAAHFSVSGAKSATPAGTPRKRATKEDNGMKKGTPGKNGGKAGGKRKRSGRMSEENNTDDSENEGFKSENDSIIEKGDTTSPSKKTRSNGEVKVEQAEENGGFYFEGEEGGIYA